MASLHAYNMITWVTAVQLLLVISSAVAVEEKESFESYFQNFFQRHQDKVPRAIANASPQNVVHTPKALPAQVSVKNQPARFVTPSLQTYNYQLAAPVSQYSYVNLPQSIQYQKLQPPTLKYTAAYIPQYQPQVAVRSPVPATALQFRPEDAIKSFSPSFQPSKEQPSRQYSFSPSLQYNKEESSRQYSFTPVKEQPSSQSSYTSVKEQPSRQSSYTSVKEQPSRQSSFSPSKEQPSRQYSFTVRQPAKEEQRQFEKYPSKEYSSKKPSYRDDEYYYKGSDQGYHEHVKVKSSHTHKKQTTGGTEDYYDGDYGDDDGKRGYRSLHGI